MNWTGRLYFAVVSLFILFAGNIGLAEQIVLKHEGWAGKGTLDGVPFEANFVFRAVADTKNVMSGGVVFDLEHDIATVELDGIGTFEFLSDTRTFVNSITQTVGFSRSLVTSFGSDLFNSRIDPQFQTWNMSTAIGPISGMGGLLQWDDISDPMLTSGGVLVFNDDPATPAIFTAIVPEPTILVLGYLCLPICLARSRARAIAR